MCAGILFFDEILQIRITHFHFLVEVVRSDDNNTTVAVFATVRNAVVVNIVLHRVPKLQGCLHLCFVPNENDVWVERINEIERRFSCRCRIFDEVDVIIHLVELEKGSSVILLVTANAENFRCLLGRNWCGRNANRHLFAVDFPVKSIIDFLDSTFDELFVDFFLVHFEVGRQGEADIQIIEVVKIRLFLSFLRCRKSRLGREYFTVMPFQFLLLDFWLFFRFFLVQVDVEIRSNLEVLVACFFCFDRGGFFFRGFFLFRFRFSTADGFRRLSHCVEAVQVEF